MLKLQQVVGRKRTFANSENIRHTATTNQNLSKAGPKDDSYALVRDSVSVQSHYEVKSGCSDCKKLRPASVRLEISVPQDLTTEDLAKFEKEVVGTAIAILRSRIQEGSARGFNPGTAEYPVATSI